MSLDNFLKYFHRKKHSQSTVAITVEEETNEVATKNENDIDINSNDISMDTHSSMPVEFVYLESLISYRLGFSERPRFLAVKHWNLPVKNFLEKLGLDKDEDVATLILIGLAPHIVPELFDQAIQEKIKTSGDFPEIGGVRGKNFRGFLPTGQTAVFLLAGNDWQKRAKVEQLFWSDHDLAQKKILWLEELSQGEPIMSGKITIALDHVDLFLFGASAPPHFGAGFPAKKISTQLNAKNIMMNKEVKRHYKHLKEWIKHNPPLMKEWGMKKRLREGFRVLFYGPPGTGKTLVANLLGNETGKDVYKIDISMVVSKYIGETEKNLELLFARAQEKDWILFFDEADAIFGKRTGVRDAHDKYANQEVSYLLQRIEDFDGLIILATNMKSNIDDAFIRRFNDIVKFTMPSEEERKEIWEKSFPDESDYTDIPEHVKKFELTGGNIINIVHFAGIQAIRKRNESMDGEQIDATNEGYSDDVADTAVRDKLKFHLEDVLEGIKKELIKEGKPFPV
ncbi:MAG TPA: ATP-binding protein [Chitinophagaceae bacterium]